MFSVSFRKAGKGVVFDGMKMSNGKGVAQSGTHLFTITLENGTTYTAKDLLSSTLTEVRLKADDEHPQLAQRIPGVAVSGTFTTPDTDGAIDVDASIDITLKPQEVIVLEGICAAGANAESDNDDDDGADAQKSKKKKKGSRKSGKKKKKARK